MRLYSEAFKLLKTSLFSNDLLILFCAIITLLTLAFVVFFSKAIGKRADEWKKEQNKSFSKSMWKWESRAYTLFTTLITIFPLLGMLGTVVGLLGLDLAAGDMNNIKNNFFLALTSTAWGIVFSVIYKLVHAFIAEDVEEKIELAKKLSEE